MGRGIRGLTLAAWALAAPATGHAQDAAAEARLRVDRLLSAPPATWTRAAEAPDLATAAVAEALVARGDDARRASEFARAAAIYGVAQDVARRAGAPAVLGAALNGAADAFFRQSAYEPTLAAARESVALHEREHLPAGLAQAWNTIGNVHQGKAEYQLALECYEKSLAIRQPLGDQRGMGQSLNNIGMVHKGLGRYAEALDHFRRALAIFEALGDRRSAAIVADNIGVIHFQQGEYGPALAYTGRALAANQAVDNAYGIAKSLDSLGNIYRTQGAYGRALASFRQALALRERMNDRHAAAETTHNIGLVHASQGDYAQAIAFYRRGLRMNAQVGDQALTTEALLNIGAAAWRAGERARAAANFRAALAISEREGFEHLTGEIRHGLGEMALARGRIATARTELGRALAIREWIADRAGVSASLTALAAASVATGDFAGAAATAQRAADNAAAHDQPELLWEAQTVVGMANRRLGRTDAAERALRDAVAGVERLRRGVVGAATRRAQFFEQKLSPYHELVALAVDRGAPAEALAVAERAKARALLELLRARAPDGSSLLADRDAADGAPFELADAEPLVRDETIAAVEYVVGDGRTDVCVITRDAGVLRVRARRIDVTRSALAALAARFRDAIAARDLRYADDARRLDALLLAPIARQLDGRARVVIVPDGPLWQVPFQALQDPRGRFVIESAAVSYAPSLTTLADILRRPRRADAAGVLAMGKADFSALRTQPGLALPSELTPLPDAERQVRLVQALYGGRAAAYLGDDASEERFKRDAPGRSVLHLATHGVLDEASPLYSHVVLTPGRGGGEDGLLEAWEILRLRLDAEVVVLSACDTARGRIAPGEGVIGMTWAFFAAGARALVVSQWQVEAASTTRLMTAFHRGLADGHVAKTDALRAASLELLRTPEHAHPFYWAGFVLVGKPF